MTKRNSRGSRETGRAERVAAFASQASNQAARLAAQADAKAARSLDAAEEAGYTARSAVVLSRWSYDMARRSCRQAASMEARLRIAEREIRLLEYERQEVSDLLRDRAALALGVAIAAAGTAAFLVNGLWAWGLFYASATIAAGLAIAGTELERPARRRYGGDR